MSKRRLSSPILPPTKRVHNLFEAESPNRIPHSLLTALYDELALMIFSHLDWADLCRITITCKHFSRLGADNELWRRLYVDVFGRTRLRGSKGFITRTDGREVRPLPARAKGTHLESDYKDYKWMFRISWNWKTGRCTKEPLYNSHRGPQPALILLAGSLTIFYSSSTPEIHLYNSATTVSHSLTCHPSARDATFSITALALDQSHPISGLLQLVAFLSTGEFLIFSIDHSNPASSTRKLTYLPARRDARNMPILQAAYHHPLLVTLSTSFTLSIYDLSHNNVVHTQSLSSFTSFPPSSLVLSTTNPSTYKLVLAYAIPVYPHHWSAGVTELIIQSNVSPMSVISTRTTRSLDTPQGFIDERKLAAMREQWSRKVLQVADIDTDGRYVVLAPSDPHPEDGDMPAFRSSSFHTSTNLQVYRLSLPPKVSIASPPPKLTFIRTLNGQMGPVDALSLADGRCISVGRNGSIWVWDLEGGPGAEVSGPTEQLYSSPSSCAVAFDERRIVTTEAGQVSVRRFDI